MILSKKRVNTLHPYYIVFGGGSGFSLHFYTKTSGSELSSSVLLHLILGLRSFLNMELTDWIDKLDRKPKDFSIVTSPALILVTGIFCSKKFFKWMWRFWAQLFIHLWQDFFTWVIFITIVHFRKIFKIFDNSIQLILIIFNTPLPLICSISTLFLLFPTLCSFAIYCFKEETFSVDFWYFDSYNYPIPSDVPWV